eukprot:m.62232 g.62232  ORF g.62232 m.62232 type:complete len:152 (+) comp11900_c1_seq4:786-1241(+)
MLIFGIRFMNSFLRRRIGIRLLLHHHQRVLNGHQTGAIENLNVQAQLSDYIQSVRAAAERQYKWAPRIVIDGHKDATFPFVEPHLKYIATELLKNAVRATVRQHDQSHSAPPIRVTLCKNRTELLFRVSDQGMQLITAATLWIVAHCTLDP